MQRLASGALVKKRIPTYRAMLLWASASGWFYCFRQSLEASFKGVGALSKFIGTIEWMTGCIVCGTILSIHWLTWVQQESRKNSEAQVDLDNT